VKTLLTTLHVRLQLGREDGQTMSEYGVVLTVITLALLASIGTLSEGIGGSLERARSAIGG